MGEKSTPLRTGQESFSPLPRRGFQLNVHTSDVRYAPAFIDKTNIYLLRIGHFYFALTAGNFKVDLILSPVYDSNDCTNIS